MKKFLSVFAATTMLTSAAVAGNIDPPVIVDVAPVAAAAGPDWSGFYAGVVGGTALGSNTWYWDDGVNTGHTLPGDWSGTPLGITLGYNHQISDSLVVGVEGDYSFGDIIAINDPSVDFGCAGGTCETYLDGLATIRGRAGFASGSMLIFGTVGYGFSNALGTDMAVPVSGEGPVSGLVWGGGVELALSNDWTAKLEYLDVDLGVLDLPTGCGPNCATAIGLQTIRVGINRQF